MREPPKRKPPKKDIGTPAPQANSGDPLDMLVPGLTPKTRELLLQLQARESEIQRWFAERPSRVTALQTKTKETLAELSHALGLALPAASKVVPPTFTVLRNPLESFCGPPTSSLLSAVLTHIGQGPQNLAAWKATPFKVVQQVAAATNASTQELNALLNALGWVFGPGVVHNPIAVLSHIHGFQPTRLIVK